MGKILISAVESGECQIELFKKRKLTQLLPPSCPLFFIFILFSSFIFFIFFIFSSFFASYLTPCSLCVT